MAKVRRIARHAHRGQLTESGELFTDHLERVARTVEERGGGWAVQQAAWLHAVPGTGVDLTRQGISWRVLRVVEALQPGCVGTRTRSWIYREYDEAFDWSPDDPRLPALAARAAAWMASRTELPMADPEITRLAMGAAGASSPAWDRMARPAR